MDMDMDMKEIWIEDGRNLGWLNWSGNELNGYGYERNMDRRWKKSWMVGLEWSGNELNELCNSRAVVVGPAADTGSTATGFGSTIAHQNTQFMIRHTKCKTQNTNTTNTGEGPKHRWLHTLELF